MKRGTPRHPKVGKLCDELGINVPTAVGLLELLWHFAAEFAPQGDIGKYDDNRIEAAMLSWFRPKGKLILALLKAGWIDQDPVSRLIVHDWRDHADASVRKRLERAGLSFVPFAEKVTGQRPATLADNGSLPDPSPAYISKPKPKPIALARWQTDETYQSFREVYGETEKSLIDADWAEAHYEWAHLDYEQQRDAIDGIRARIDAQVWDDPKYIPAPKRYLERREWKRAITPAKKATTSMTVEEIANL